MNTLTKRQAIDLLHDITLSEDIGLGGYQDTAAYKFCNGDISRTTEGLPDDVREAIGQWGGEITWDDFPSYC